MSSHVERELFERLLEQIRELWSGTPLQALESALLMLPPEMQVPHPPSVSAATLAYC
jgi:hypothetical protein